MDDAEEYSRPFPIRDWETVIANIRKRYEYFAADPLNDPFPGTGYVGFSYLYELALALYQIPNIRNHVPLFHHMELEIIPKDRGRDGMVTLFPLAKDQFLVRFGDIIRGKGKRMGVFNFEDTVQVTVKLLD